MVYLWGGGIRSPAKLTLPQHDSDVVQVAIGRALKTGVSKSGRMIIWDSNKKAVDISSDGAEKGRLLEDMWVPRFLEGQSGVTIVEVSCGDFFVACLTGEVFNEPQLFFCVIRVYLFCSLSFFHTSMLVSFVKFLCIFLCQLQLSTCFLHHTFFFAVLLYLKPESFTHTHFSSQVT